MADPKLVESILKSYREVGGINHLDGVNLPSREAIAEILRDLLRIIFPGYYDRTAMRSDQALFFVSQILTSVSERLRTEIQKSLEYAYALSQKTSDETHFATDAKQVTDHFLKKLPDVRRQLALDVEAAYEGDPAAVSRDEIILAYPYLEALSVQRMAHLLYRSHVILIPRIMTEWAHSRTGIDIHPGAQIGPSFYIDHGTGVVVGETAVIGAHVKMYQGVSLVAKSVQKSFAGAKRHPTVEDDVTIYANTTILGGETTVGAGSTIAANVFLTHSVPPDSLVIPEETGIKIIPKKKTLSDPSSHDFQI